MVNGYPDVKVIGAPGFEDFDGELIMEVPGPQGLMSIVGDRETKHVDVIPSIYVTVVSE